MLQLLQVIAAIPVTARSVELVQADDHLGPLAARELEALWAMRRSVARQTIELGHAAWDAVCRGRRRVLSCAATRPRSHISRRPSGGCWRNASRFPERTASSWRRYAIEPKAPLELFLASQAREEAVFLGDAWCFLHLYELSLRGLVRPRFAAAPAPRRS